MRKLWSACWLRNTERNTRPDLENAFDRVWQEVFWWAHRTHNVLEEQVDWIKTTYYYTKYQDQCRIGITKKLSIRDEEHQGLVLSLLHFIMVIDAIMRDTEKSPIASPSENFDNISFALPNRIGRRCLQVESSNAAAWPEANFNKTKSLKLDF